MLPVCLSPVTRFGIYQTEQSVEGLAVMTRKSTLLSSTGMTASSPQALETRQSEFGIWKLASAELFPS